MVRLHIQTRYDFRMLTKKQLKHIEGRLMDERARALKALGSSTGFPS